MRRAAMTPTLQHPASDADQSAALDAIDRRQDEILGQLDELNARILRVLADIGAAAPKLPPSLQPKAKAA